MSRLRWTHDEKNTLLIDLPTVEKDQKESNENWENSKIKKHGNIALHTKVETNQIFIPTSLQCDLTEWRHQNLKHSGGDRMRLTMKEMLC